MFSLPVSLLSSTRFLTPWHQSFQLLNQLEMFNNHPLLDHDRELQVAFKSQKKKSYCPSNTNYWTITKSSSISRSIFVWGKLPQDPSLFISGLDRSPKEARHNTVYEHKVCMGGGGAKARSFTVTKSCAIAQGLSVNNALNSSQPLWAITLLWGEKE